jgi:UDP-N-acetyl-D-mannosaminuronate dehydrogenase
MTIKKFQEAVDAQNVMRKCQSIIQIMRKTKLILIGGTDKIGKTKKVNIPILNERD